ncbi:isochorismate synthase [Priestia megaterium]|nr:isochorismate synthase [Priestia megaterium]
MIAITEQLIHDHIKHAIECAKNESKTKLVSLVKKVRPIDPLIFYANGYDQFCGERFCWRDPNQQYTFVGLGCVYTIHATEGKNRFLDTEKEWERFINEVFYPSESTTPNGTGPLLFGGFSFDSNQEADAYWTDFPNGKFIIPSVLYTEVESHAYLSININVDGSGQLSDYFQKIEESEKLLLNEHFDGNSYVTPLLLQKEELDSDQFKKNVEKATSLIKQGEIEKVVLARQLEAIFSERISTEYVLQRLLREQPTSYTYIFEGPNQHFIGASPERLVQKEEEYVFSTCLAGSIRRGKTRQEDQELGHELLNDEKNLIEHDVVVHMIKEAMEAYCSEIEVPTQPSLYKTKHIQHLYTPVRGKIKHDVTLFSFIERLHPTPALGGYPQQKAMSIIRHLEPFNRGWYAAPIGWIDINGNGEFIVGIRSGVIEENKAMLFAGCGIVADSTSESEYEETNIKFNPMLSALGGIVRGTY